MNEHTIDTEQTFAALPPARGRGFARTWWGHAWLKALEDTALDAQQVRTGSRLARAGAVGAVSVRPGRITAVVHAPDGTAHRADVLLERLSDDQWSRFPDVAVERSGHLAALLDRDLPPDLVEDAAAAGIELLPGIGVSNRNAAVAPGTTAGTRRRCATWSRGCWTRIRSCCC